MDKKEVIKKLGGEIVFSNNPGETLKQWRINFNISQKELAEKIGITQSTLSDYERGRRNPGLAFIKKYIEGLINIDFEKGGKYIDKYFSGDKDAIIVRDFEKPISIDYFLDIIEGIPITEYNSEQKIVGYTIIDSLKAIMETPIQELVKIYGSNPMRALIFLNVDTGRSTMIAVRLSGIKPGIVVLHNPNSIDPIAKKIAEKNDIPLVYTKLNKQKLRKKLEIK